MSTSLSHAQKRFITSLEIWGELITSNTNSTANALEKRGLIKGEYCGHWRIRWTLNKSEGATHKAVYS